MIPFFSSLIRSGRLNTALNILIFVHPSISQDKEAVLLGDSHQPEITGNESDNYIPAAENPVLPILFPTLNSGVCFFVCVFFETVLTFHLTAGHYKQQTTAAKSRETKERRKESREILCC